MFFRVVSLSAAMRIVDMRAAGTRRADYLSVSLLKSPKI